LLGRALFAEALEGLASGVWQSEEKRDAEVFADFGGAFDGLV
jgi:hypothetical protein